VRIIAAVPLLLSLSVNPAHSHALIDDNAPLELLLSAPASLSSSSHSSSSSPLPRVVVADAAVASIAASAAARATAAHSGTHARAPAARAWRRAPLPHPPLANEGAPEPAKGI